MCPWHKYDFDLKTGYSDHGLRACTFAVQFRQQENKKKGKGELEIWVETPDKGEWEVVELRPVSEGTSTEPPPKVRNLSDDAFTTSEFADPPPPPKTAVDADVKSDEAQSNDDLPNPLPSTLLEWSVLILNTANPERKVILFQLTIISLSPTVLFSLGRAHAPSNRRFQER